MSTAELTGHRVTRAVISIPASGAWSADVVLDDDGADLSASAYAARLVLEGVTFVGTLVRAPSPYLGALAVRVVAGAGGWRQEVPARAYRADAGVALSTVVGDVAREVGERVRVEDDRALGSAFVRERCPAARVLNQTAPGWYVGADGTTVVGARTSTAIGSPFVLLAHDGGFATYRVATETPGDWTPGRRFVAPSGFVSIGSVLHTLDGGTLRTEVLA